MGLAPLNGAAPWEKPGKKIHKRGKTPEWVFFLGTGWGQKVGGDRRDLQGRGDVFFVSVGVRVTTYVGCTLSRDRHVYT